MTLRDVAFVFMVLSVGAGLVLCMLALLTWGIAVWVAGLALAGYACGDDDG